MKGRRKRKSHHAHAHHHHAKNPAKPRKHRRRPASAAAAALPAGMVMMPVSALGAVRNPAHSPKRKHKHRKHRHHHPSKHNPAPIGEELKQAGTAVAFGFGAAIAGVAGGLALSKAGLTSKFANVAANVAAGALIGGGLGLLDRAAGTVVAHNYGVAAMQWATMPASSGPSGTDSAQRRLMAGSPARLTGAPRAALPAVRAIHGPAEVEGVIADNMGDPIGAPEEIGAYETLEGTDDVGAYEKLEGFDDVGNYEKLEGVIADNMGDAYEIEGELAELEDIGDADLF